MTIIDIIFITTELSQVKPVDCDALNLLLPQAAHRSITDITLFTSLVNSRIWLAELAYDHYREVLDLIPATSKLFSREPGSYKIAYVSVHSETILSVLL